MFNHIKTIIKSNLIKWGIYEKYEYSLLHRMYIHINNPSFIKSQQQILLTNKKRILPNSLVFDIGANVGNKTDIYLKLGCKVISVEPDPKNVKILRRRFSQNKNFILVDQAVSDNEGISQFYILDPGSAYNTLSEKWKNTLDANNSINITSDQKKSDCINITTTTLNTLINRFGRPDYIKIDVEGYEIQVLRGLNNKIKLISFEANLPEFTQETIEIILHLQEIDNQVKFNYVLSDTGDYVLAEWMDYINFINLIQNTEIRYMEIYAKM